jgi:hypothetical protein
VGNYNISLTWRGSPVQIRAGPLYLSKKEVEMELPIYSIKQNSARILLPRVIILLLLSGMLYLGIRVNFYVFNMDFPDMINTVVTAGIIILAVADVFMTKSRNRENKVYFFSDRIEIRGKDNSVIMLGTVRDAEVRKNLFDMLFRTGTVALSSGQTIKNINYPDRIRDYIVQLIRRAPQVISR